MGDPSTVGSQDDQVCSPRGSCNPCHSGVFGESARVSRRHLIPAFGWRTGMRRQGGPRRSNTPGSRPKRIARLARSAIPQSRSLSRDQLRPTAVQYGRPAPIRIWPLFTEAARPTTMLYVLSMPRRQRSRETKRQYFPPAAQWSPPRSHSTVGCGHEFGGVGRSCPHLRPRLERSRVRNCPVGLG